MLAYTGRSIALITYTVSAIAGKTGVSATTLALPSGRRASTCGVIMSPSNYENGLSVEQTARLFEAATSAGTDALLAYGNMVEKARAFFTASYAAIHAAQCLVGHDYEAAIDRLFVRRGHDKPKDRSDVNRWFKGVAPHEFLQRERFKSARTKYAKALGNALRADLTPEEVRVLLTKGGIHALSLKVPVRSAPKAEAGDQATVNAPLGADAEIGPSLDQEREMHAVQDRAE